MKEPQPVSCMCLTYGRPRVLEEAIHSFITQDYDGEKELIVLNDMPEQTLTCDLPGVRVINVSKRFKTVGEKRNACAALASHDWLAVWDDDDIYLPHRLKFSMTMMDERKRFFKPSKAMIFNDGKITGIKANLFHSGGLWHRSLFDEVRGYAHMGSGQDMEIEIRFDKVIGGGKNYDRIQPHEHFYLYRWAGTGSYHLSGFGQDKAGGKTGNDKVGEYVQRHIQNQKLKLGEIQLQPQWRLDYPQLVRDYLATNP